MNGIDPYLKPCPFCGGSVRLSVGMRGNGADLWRIRCAECQIALMGSDDGDESNVVAAWNRRPGEDRLVMAWVYVTETGLADECNLKHAENLTDLIHQMAKTIAGYREEVKYLGRLRIEIVGALTAAGICMLVDADPTAYGEVRSAVKRLAAERDTAKNELAAAVEHAGRLTRERNTLREQARVRDARGERPDDYKDVLVYDGREWFIDHCYGAWWASGLLVINFPFWLPMPSAPETL